MQRTQRDETHIPTVQQEKASEDRVSGKDEDERRAENHCPSPPKGPGQAHGLGDRPKTEPDRRLSRRQRISDRATFRDAFDGGERYAGRFLVVWLCRGKDASLRLGVIASKRTLRRAVDRARAKRLLREAYRLSRHRFKPGVDVILIARRAILSAACGDVVHDLLRTARRGGIIAAPDCGAGIERRQSSAGGRNGSKR